MAGIAPIPWNVAVIQLDPQTGRPLPGFGLSREFGNWFQTSIIAPVSSAPRSLSPVRLTNQSASITTTPIPTASLAAGLYRVSYYAAITTADAVSSSLTVTVSWTESALTKSLSGAPMTGNTTTTVQSSTALIEIDGSPISYSTTYVSNTPGQMKYRLSLVIESIAL